MKRVCQAAKRIPLRFVGTTVAMLLVGCAGVAQSPALAADVVRAQTPETQDLQAIASTAAAQAASPIAAAPATEALPQAATVQTVASSAVAEQFPDYTVKNEDARPPIGWDTFCARYEQECHSKPAAAPRVVKLTPEVWRLIVEANTRVNASVRSLADMRHWGRVNVWTYPTDGYGDCKDYALEKQRVLLQQGLPREDLLLTVVWTHSNEGHAVLIVRTDQGDYVLDSLSPHVLPWRKTNLDFVKRQSQTDPNAWVYIDGYRRGNMELAVKAN